MRGTRATDPRRSQIPEATAITEVILSEMTALSLLPRRRNMTSVEIICNNKSEPGGFSSPALSAASSFGNL
jgi:hypothetical protein